MDGRTNGWMDGWMDGWLAGWLRLGLPITHVLGYTGQYSHSSQKSSRQHLPPFFFSDLNEHWAYGVRGMLDHDACGKLVRAHITCSSDTHAHKNHGP